MIVVIDGPEKAGKTTLIGAVRSALISRGVNVVIRKWGPVFPDDRVYSPAIRGDLMNDETVTIWDRSWAAEAVCGKLLGRDRRLSNDWFLGEWLHGRVTRSFGAMFMVLPIQKDELAARRDDTDIPVDHIEEFNAYFDYSKRFNWQTLWNDYTLDSLENNVKEVLSKLDSVREFGRDLAIPNYVGPQDADVVVVGKSPSDYASITGSWTPFSSRLTTMLGRYLGRNSLLYGWSDLSNLEHQAIADRELVILCGNGNRPDIPSSTKNVIAIDDPSYTFSRFGQPSEVKVIRGDISFLELNDIFPTFRVSSQGVNYYEPLVKETR